MFSFRWIRWNVEKCESHGVSPAEAEYVIDRARRPFPMGVDDEKVLVWGRTERKTAVVYLVGDDGVLFVIHARPLTTKEKSRFRRRRG
jgi:hypothetical protein